ncbi:MAG: hypothetical protein JRJ41_09870 [Deltaproteobacteria bacterium]|nr:hypothetical protein [Deltaproteobacteria bacterium]
MPETRIIEFTLREVAKALVIDSDIHEGFWGIMFKFGIQGANISPGPKDDLTPAAIVPILNMALQRFDVPNNLTVDAAKVNPRGKTTSNKKPAPKKKSAPSKKPAVRKIRVPKKA